MNIIRLILVAIASLTLFSACSKKDESLPPQGPIIEANASGESSDWRIITRTFKEERSGMEFVESLDIKMWEMIQEGSLAQKIKTTHATLAINNKNVIVGDVVKMERMHLRNNIYAMPDSFPYIGEVQKSEIKR